MIVVGPSASKFNDLGRYSRLCQKFLGLKIFLRVYKNILENAVVLGLRNINGKWYRKKDLPTEITYTKRTIAQKTAQPTGIDLVADWLRLACSYLKRLASTDWDEKLTPEIERVFRRFVEDW